MAAGAITERSVVDVLRAALERISDEDRWVRDMSAADPSGEPIEPNSANAYRWCAIGALRAELGISSEDDRQPLDDVEVFLRVAALEIADGAADGPVDLNDEGGHETTLRMFSRAIELAEAEA